MALNTNRKPRELPSVEDEWRRFTALGIGRGSLVKIGHSGTKPWEVVAIYTLLGRSLSVLLTRGSQKTRNGRRRAINRTVFSWEITELWKD